MGSDSYPVSGFRRTVKRHALKVKGTECPL